MKKSTWVILGSVAIAAGIGYYFWSKKDKSEDATEEKAGFVSASDKIGTLVSKKKPEPTYTDPKTGEVYVKGTGGAWVLK